VVKEYTLKPARFQLEQAAAQVSVQVLIVESCTVPVRICAQFLQRWVNARLLPMGNSAWFLFGIVHGFSVAPCMVATCVGKSAWFSIGTVHGSATCMMKKGAWFLYATVHGSYMYVGLCMASLWDKCTVFHKESCIIRVWDLCMFRKLG
jgi:hypothetical protein